MVMSDLHLEFAGLEPDMDAAAAADVVVLAGDIHPGVEGIRWARTVFPDKPIVYVAGNHEFYGCVNWDDMLNLIRETAKDNDVHFLENDAVTILGVRFLGSTLWTDFEYFGQYAMKKMMHHAERSFSDYLAIGAIDGMNGKLTAQMTLKRHRESRAWLETELPKGDPANTVVVSHHYPHRSSTEQKYLGDAVTAAFGSHIPLEMMMQAGLWIHGHAHCSFNYRLDGAGRNVHVVCNPRGYPLGWKDSDNENPHFDPGLLITRLPDGSWGKFTEGVTSL